MGLFPDRRHVDRIGLLCIGSTCAEGGTLNRVERRFDPDEWTRIHGDGGALPRAFVFRRGLQLALEACLRHSQAGDLWLDAACGRGQLATALVARGRTALRLDLDRAMLEMPANSPLQNQRHANQPSISTPGSCVEDRSVERDQSAEDTTRAHLLGVCADAVRTPFRNEHFRGLVAVSFLGCLDDPIEFFLEAARVLQPGGILVITVTNRSSLLRRISHIIGTGSLPGGAISGTIRSHEPRAIEDALIGAGFEILERRRYHFIIDVGPWSFPTPRMSEQMEGSANGGRADSLARNRLLVARKTPKS